MRRRRKRRGIEGRCRDWGERKDVNQKIKEEVNAEYGERIVMKRMNR